MDTRERFLVRTMGGPLDGETRVANEDPRSGIWEWPLPSVLAYKSSYGEYVKVTESSLPPMPEGGHVMRGATYMWRPFDAST